MSKPVAGVRILDFTRYLAGPYGTYQLALLGADVVKIESQEGDETRGQLADKKWAERKMAPSFLAVNGNKRSITLDLRKPEASRSSSGSWSAPTSCGRTSAAVMDPRPRLRGALRHQSAAHLLRGLGLRPDGPEKATAAFDGKLQAMSGSCRSPASRQWPTRAGSRSATHRWRDGGPRRRERALPAHAHRARQLVDVAMLDAALAFIPGPVSEYTVAGIEQRQIGNGSVSRKVTANRFRTRDGFIVLAVLTEKQFASLMKALGQPHALADPRFRDWPARTANEPALREIIETALATDDARSWEARLTEADVPCGSIWKIHEIVDHPQLEHRDVMQTIDSRYGPMKLVGAGFRLEHGSPGIDREPPTLGEHTGEILKEAGYDDDEIERLRRDAVI